MLSVPHTHYVATEQAAEQAAAVLEELLRGATSAVSCYADHLCERGHELAASLVGNCFC